MTESANIGPTNRSLVIVGGGGKIAGILKRFIALAGGPGASIVIIPTADEEDHFGPSAPGLKKLMDAGAINIHVLHTRNRATANSDAFTEPLRQAQGVWKSSGRHWRLAYAYLNTKTHEELRALLDRGGVIGGSSTGATIQGSFMTRGDTSGNTILIGDHTEGFGLLKNVCIDQHLLRRNRQFDLIEVVEQHPELLGIGIDENTAIIVRNDRFHVIGQSYVAIVDHDRGFGPRGKYFFLAPGDRLNLDTRWVIDRGGRKRIRSDRRSGLGSWLDLARFVLASELCTGASDLTCPH